VDTKLGNLPLVFMKVLILFATDMYSFLDKVPVFTFSTGFGAFATVFTVTALSLFLLMFVVVVVNSCKYCADVTFLFATVTLFGTVF